MMPILYDYDEIDFTTMGLGALPDAIKCTVTEERNGAYELAMTYPLDGLNFSNLAVDRIILAPPNDQDRPQPFRIYACRPSMAGTVNVAAEHISYQLNSIPCEPFNASDAGEALQGLKDHAVGPMPFGFWTDKKSRGGYTQATPDSIRSRLGGVQGSILDVYGGEYEWDRFLVKLHEARGEDNGVVVAYGKNLISLEQETNIATMITGIYPYYFGEAGEEKGKVLVQLPERLITVAANCSYPRVKPVDMTDKFEAPPTEAQLRAAANTYIRANKLTAPKVSIAVSFVPLWQTEEYKDIAPLERVRLCDYVTVRFLRLGVDAKAQVVKTVHNVLLNRYDSMELGDARQSLDSTIANLIKGGR